MGWESKCKGYKKPTEEVDGSDDRLIAPARGLEVWRQMIGDLGRAV